MAADARDVAQSAALKTLNEFQFASTTPFGSRGSELAIDLLTEANAVALVISNSIGDNDEGRPIRDIHLSLAVSAIGSLMALAAFALEGGA